MNRNAQLLLIVTLVLLVPAVAQASTTGGDFEPLYNFIYGAVTGYLGRSIALVGGVIGLGMGAATGRALPALLGVILAVFGTLGPTIINSLFAGAVI